MVFTSFEFALFFSAVLLVRACIKSHVVEKCFLLLASYAFYLSWSGSLIVVIVLTSTADFYIGRRLGDEQSDEKRARLLWTSILLTLGILGVFRYSTFALDNIFAVLANFGIRDSGYRLDIPPPLGISYVAFSSASYIIDVYYQRLRPCRSILDYALFLAYFPKVLAGPIVRATTFLPQLRDRLRTDAGDLETGLAHILSGVFKKLVVSDQIAPHVNLIFSTPGQFDRLTLLQGALGYSAQIYCDFSGYSDIAVGCARMMGIRLPDNFRFPYSATSITEFWRRWHITLSDWFRDYVFLPLELARRSHPNPAARASTNLMITMLLCGLWHGASWTFVIWGGVHGVALVMHGVWRRWDVAKHLGRRRLVTVPGTWMARLLTLAVVLIGWVVFRADSLGHALQYLSGMVWWHSEATRLTSPYIVAAVVGLIGTHLLLAKDSNWAEELPKCSVATRVGVYSCMLALVVFLGASDSVPFIYFRF